ncbi:hypothetical protein N0K73_05355 [Dellaglioa algida]|uniref:hypothetical protein n=1 Tax=Dellaglioa algida TaxID=105612 RepID=UPI0024C4A6F4|nr:hypothetical protein [Dellaglioa algida]MDK1716615.1 hypothetical protein [Dellaglioa algida]MDK1718698.1 hypothetical protein [Dellaglioa algida]MDK1721557.1 hypothetical protein [Dellaglioa algida]
MTNNQKIYRNALLQCVSNNDIVSAIVRFNNHFSEKGSVIINAVHDLTIEEKNEVIREITLIGIG